MGCELREWEAGDTGEHMGLHACLWSFGLFGFVFGFGQMFGCASGIQWYDGHIRWCVIEHKWEE